MIEFSVYPLLTEVKWKRGGSQKQICDFFRENEFNPFQHMVKKEKRAIFLETNDSFPYNFLISKPSF